MSWTPHPPDSVYWAVTPRRVWQVAAFSLAVFLSLLLGHGQVRAAAGDLDPAFGTGGKVTTDFGSSDVAWSVAVQADGKVVAAGYSGSSLALARYTVSGGLDSSFGVGGKVTTPLGSSGATRADVAIQSDGKIVVVGEANGDFLVARYTTAGVLDATFGSGGLVSTNFSGFDLAIGVAIQPDGKLVVVGSGSPPGDLLVARYTATGSLDPMFGVGGKVTTDVGGADGAESVALQPDGKIVVAGTTSAGPSPSNFALARYVTSGALDPTFGGGGLVITDLGASDTGRSMALQADGKIVVGGLRGSDFAVARYTTSGSLDATFGTGGKVTTTLGPGTDGWAVAVQSDGKIVMVGYTGGPGGADFALVRYTTTGALDVTFGSGGIVLTDFGGSLDVGLAVSIAPDRKIVVAGYRASGGPNDFAVARYSGSTTPTNADQCKDGGYLNFIDPSTGQPFRSQGQCIQFVNTGR